MLRSNINLFPRIVNYKLIYNPKLTNRLFSTTTNLRDPITTTAAAVVVGKCTCPSLWAWSSMFTGVGVVSTVAGASTSATVAAGLAAKAGPAVKLGFSSQVALVTGGALSTVAGSSLIAIGTAGFFTYYQFCG